MTSVHPQKHHCKVHEFQKTAHLITETCICQRTRELRFRRYDFGRNNFPYGSGKNGTGEILSFQNHTPRQQKPRRAFKGKKKSLLKQTKVRFYPPHTHGAF